MQSSTNSHCMLLGASDQSAKDRARARLPTGRSCLTEAERCTLAPVLDRSRVVIRGHIRPKPKLARRGRKLQETRQLRVRIAALRKSPFLPAAQVNHQPFVFDVAIRVRSRGHIAMHKAGLRRGRVSVKVSENGVREGLRRASGGAEREDRLHQRTDPPAITFDTIPAAPVHVRVRGLCTRDVCKRTTGKRPTKSTRRPGRTTRGFG